MKLPLLIIFFVGVVGRGTTALHGPMCSKMAIPGLKVRGQPYFLGRATPDTVLAGLGTVTPGDGDGHFGPSGSGSIYGQVITVIRPGNVSRILKPGTQVVVVPWDYDPACQPLPWGRSTSWVPLHGVRFFYPVLRPESLWVRSMPTFDAYSPDSDVIPSRYSNPVFPYEGDVATADELFAFYDALPILDGRDISDTVMNVVRHWAGDNSSLARKAPIHDVIWLMSDEAERTRARQLALPMLGTYRLAVTLPSGEQRIAFLRTASCSEGLHYLITRRDPPRDDPFSTRAIGVEVQFFVAPDDTELPTTEDLSKRGMWGWHVGWPESVRSDSTWPAEIDPWQFRSIWKEDDKLMDRLFEGHERWFDKNFDLGTLPVWLGAFQTGSFRFVEHISMGDAGELVVRAERRSNQTVPCDLDGRSR
jgi:hypothetical protein